MLWIEPLVMAGYGWLWLVMRFSLVLGTEFELSVAVHGPGSFLDGDKDLYLRHK